MERLKKQWINWATVLLPIAVFLVIRLIFDFNGLYGQDGYEYARYTNSLKDYFLGGAFPREPYWPVLFPLVGSMLSFILSTSLALQLVSLFSMIGACWYIRKILLEIYKEYEDKTGLFVLLVFSSSPYLLKAETLAMSDLLCLFLIVSGVYYSLLFKRGGAILSGGLAALLLTSAVMTRYAAALVVLPLGLYLLIVLFQHRAWKATGIMLLTTSIAIIPYLVFRSETPFSFLSQELPRTWSLANFFSSEFANADGIHRFGRINLVFVLFNIIHPGFLVLGIPLLFFVRKKELISMIAYFFVGAIVLNALFLAGTTFQSTRYLILSFPFVIILLYPAFTRMVKRVKHEGLKWIIPMALIFLQIGLFSYVWKSLYQLNRFEKELVQELNEYKSAKVFACGVEVALGAYALPHSIVPMWTSEISKGSVGDLVVFNQEMVREKWPNHAPLKHWHEFNSSFELVLERQYENGYALYQLKDRN